MRTTIDLPDGLYREAKMMAVKQGTTLREVVVGLIQAGLHGGAVGKGGQAAIRRDGPPVAIRKVPGDAPTPPWTNRQLAALLEEEELKSCRMPSRNSEAES